MSFPFNVYLLALGGSGGVAWLSLPLWRRWCLRVGLVDDPGARKIHDHPIPLAGGLAVLTGICLPVLTAATVLLLAPGQFSPALIYGFEKRALELSAILLGAVAITMLGWLDDRHELRPSAKFAGQVIIALAVAAAGVRLTLFVPNLVFSYAVTVLWIVTLVNALNFLDNMNGLCTGLGVIAAWQFAVASAAEGQYLVALLALLACGALLGFLPHNFPRATAFLGDAGSHLVGFLLAVLAILPHFHTPKNPRPLAVLLPLAILAVPLLDLAWVVGLRWRAGQPFYLGDNNHLSHRLVRRGLSQTTAVLVIWLLAALCGLVTLL